jgi:hypothetical protein
MLVEHGILPATFHREFGPGGFLCTIEVLLSEAKDKDNGADSKA